MEEDEAKRRHQIAVLREKSRRQYLEKREGDQLQALEGDLKDEEYLFDKEELTTREKEDLRMKRELLNIAKQYNKVQESDGGQRYQIPEEKRGQNVKQNYDQVDEQYVGKYKNEQEKWEADHFKGTHFTSGGQDKMKKIKDKEKDYDLIVDDDMIDFVQAFTISGEGKDGAFVHLSFDTGVCV